MGIRYRALTWCARKQPTLVKATLAMWLRVQLWRHRAPQEGRLSTIRDALNIVDYRVPAKARLGNGMHMIVPWNDDGGRAIYETGYYEPQTVKLFQQLLVPGMVVVDVGANVGQYTLVASDLVGSTGAVHSFEPDPITFRWLSRNVRANRLRNVFLNQAALFNETAKKQLYLANPRDTGSNTLVGKPWTYSGHRCEVSCTTLDEYLAARRISRVDFIKIDVEGAELPALQGAQVLLRRADKPMLIVEFEEERQQALGVSCATLAAFLTSHDYALFRIGSLPLERYVIGPNEPQSVNVLGLPEAQVAAVFKTLATEEPLRRAKLGAGAGGQMLTG